MVRTMETTIPRKLLSKVRKNPKVIAAYLFGSRVKGKGKSKPRDIDVCVISEGLDINEMAELALGFDPPYDISFMERMQDAVAFNVLREGKPLFVKNRKKFASVWLSVARKKLEYGPMQSRVFRGVSKWMTSKHAQTA